MEENLSNIITKKFNRFFLWIQDSVVRALIFIFIAIVLLQPLIIWLQGLISKIPYLLIVQSVVYFFQQNFTLVDYIFLTFLIAILFLVSIPS